MDRVCANITKNPLDISPKKTSIIRGLLFHIVCKGLHQSHSFKASNGEFCIYRFDIVTHALLPVLNIGLIDQGIVLKETIEFSFGDIVEHGLWLSFLTKLVFGNLNLFFYRCSIDALFV